MGKSIRTKDLHSITRLHDKLPQIACDRLIDIAAHQRTVRSDGPIKTSCQRLNKAKPILPTRLCQLSIYYTLSSFSAVNLCVRVCEKGINAQQNVNQFSGMNRGLVTRTYVQLLKSPKRSSNNLKWTLVRHTGNALYAAMQYIIVHMKLRETVGLHDCPVVSFTNLSTIWGNGRPVRLTSWKTSTISDESKDPRLVTSPSSNIHHRRHTLRRAPYST